MPTQVVFISSALVLLLVFSAPAVIAQDAPAPVPSLLNQIDDLVQMRMQRDQVPGFALTVLKDGKMMVHRGYGFADVQAGIPVTNRTVFGLASCTKTFTALTLLMLVDQGLVKLDDPLGKYISGLDREYGSLTIRQLASMTGGVPKVVQPEVLWGPKQIEIMEQQGLHGRPGAQFEYSNFSYRLLGSVIENVTGKRYEQTVRERILNPLQMDCTGTTVQLTPTGMVAQAYSGGSDGKPLRMVPYKNPQVSFSAGMLATTNDDFTKYAIGLLTQPMLSPEGFNTLWYFRPPLTTGQPSNWAFGWASTKPPAYGGQSMVAMNGGTPGVASTIILFPQSNAAVVSLANIQKPEAHAIAYAVAKLIFAQPNREREEEDQNLIESGP